MVSIFGGVNGFVPNELARPPLPSNRAHTSQTLEFPPFPAFSG